MPMWRWINPDNFRYYQASLVLDLFGDWTLLCAWGGLGSMRGNYSITGVSSYEDGLRKIDELDAYRKKRGYVSVSTFANWASQIAEMRGTPFTPLPMQLEQKPEVRKMDLVLE